MKKRLAVVVLLAASALGAQVPSGWYFNGFLFMMWQWNPSLYAAFVEGGAPCYAWVGDGASTSPQPACWYDATNTNSGE